MQQKVNNCQPQKRLVSGQNPPGIWDGICPSFWCCYLPKRFYAVMLYCAKQSRLLTETLVFLAAQQFAGHGGGSFHCLMRTYVPVSPLVHPLLTLTPISPQFFQKNLLSHLFSFFCLFLYRFLFSGGPFVYLGFFSIFLVILFSFNSSFCFPIFIKALYLLGFLRSIVFHIANLT